MPSIKATWFLGTLLMSCLVATATAVSVGANLSGVNDWTLSRPFVDLMRTARAFGSAQEPWDENPGPLGPNRWPLGDFGVIVVTAQAVGTLTGSYPFVVKGGGPNLQLGLVATSGQLSTPVYSAGTNMWTATMTLQSSATQVMFSVRNHNNSITAISIRRPGYADIQIFTHEFLAIVKPYSMLRFLEWAETNGNSIAEWSDRSTPQSAYSLHGAPWEWMVELANTVDADIWVNVPTLASEDYVLNLANLLKSSVERGRKIYVEYSNEVWNGDFAQYYWNRDLALDEVASGNSSLNYDGTTDPYTLAMRRVADRIKKISDLFTSVFGQNARNTRFRPVLASQMGNSWVLNKQVTYLEVVYGTPKKWIYAVAGAPYFNLGYARKWNNLTATQVLDLLEETAEGVPKNYSYTQQIGLAVYHKLKYLGYEGGPDTFGPGSIAAKETASLSPRIGTICRNYLLKWFSYGFSTFCWYIGDATSYNSEYGTWGVTNNITFLAATKYQALVNISNTPAPQLTAGILVPALIDARDFIGAPSDYKANNPKLCNFPPYAKYDYLLRLANAGNATFQLNQVVTPDAGFGCSVWVNSDFVANLTLPHQGSPADTAFTSSVSLQAGFAVVRLVFLPSPDFGNGWMGVSVGNVTVNGSAGDGYSAGENGNDESESDSDDNGALGTTGDLVTSGGCSLSRLLYSAAAASISCLWRGWLASRSDPNLIELLN